MVQLNCARDLAVMAQLNQLMLEERIDVALLTEPYGYRGITVPAQYNIFGCAQQHGTPYAAIAVRASLSPVPVHQPGEKNGVCVSINWCGKDIFVASVYCKWRGVMAPYTATMQSFIAIASGHPVLFGLDANATSQAWLSKPDRANNNRLANRGVELEQFICEQGLVVLNEQSPYYTFCGRGTRRRASDIDVTLANRSWENEFGRTWSLSSRETTSDHNLIRINVTTADQERQQEPLLRWNTRNANWQEYVARLRTETADLNVLEHPLGDVVSVLQAAVHRVNDSMFRRTGAWTATSTRWWNADLRRRRAKVRAARKRWQAARARQLPTEVELAITYHSEQSAYKKEILAAKQVHWRSFVRTEGNTHPWGEVYKFCRGKRFTPISAVRDEAGLRTTSRAESVQVLLRSFFPPGPNSDETPAVNAEDEPFTFEEIDVAVHRNRKDKAPGPDGITASMVRRLWYAAPDKVLQLLERCRAEGEFPKAWKEARLVILLKKPDKDQTDRRSYRPICLLPVLGKTLERVMVNRLLIHATPHPKQYGFTVGRGTEDALLELVAETRSCTDRYLIGIFVDFRGAFDNLRWDKVLRKLAVTTGENYLWRSYFRDRTVFVPNGSQRIHREVQRGCPQGSICGPAVWNLLMEDLLKLLEENNCKAIAYADDLVLFISGNTRVQLDRVATQKLQLVVEWGESVGVPVNEDKTVQTQLKGDLSATRPPNIRLGERGLKYAKVVTYLGVCLGERLSFEGHIRMVKQKAQATAGSLQRVLRKDWGLTRKTVLLMFRSLFVPCMGYGSIIWAHDANCHLLTQSHRVVLYATLPFCRTVSTVAMEVLAGQMPWDLEARRLHVMAKLRKGIPLVDADLVQQVQLNGLNPKEREALVKNVFLDEWQRRWDNEHRGRTTYQWIPSVRFSSEHGYFNPSMQLLFLLTGYGSLNATLKARNAAPSALCPTCQTADETWDHFLVDCPTYAHIRESDEWHIVIAPDGTPDVSVALRQESSFAALNCFAKTAFKIRKDLVQPIAAD